MPFGEMKHVQIKLCISLLHVDKLCPASVDRVGKMHDEPVFQLLVYRVTAYTKKTMPP